MRDAYRSALRLSQLLVDEPQWVLGKRVLLLGAGLGLEGVDGSVSRPDSGINIA